MVESSATLACSSGYNRSGESCVNCIYLSIKWEIGNAIGITYFQLINVDIYPQ